MEISHQLRGRVSERMIHDCLDEKYKQKHRVENARKQKKKLRDHENLAAPVPLNSNYTNQEKNEVLIDTTGRAISEPQSPRSKADPESSKTFDSDKEVSDSPIDEGRIVGECSLCKKYELQIQELMNERKPPDQVDFEFFMPLEELRHCMEPIYRETAGRGNAWFHGILDIRTGRVTEVSTGRAVSNISEENGEGAS
jgi:hypothetical protein